MSTPIVPPYLDPFAFYQPTLRTRRVEREGSSLIRFWNDIIFEDADAVSEAIHRPLLDESPPPWPFPASAGGDT